MSEQIPDLWARLAQEAESTPCAQVVLPRDPVSRRITLKEKLAGAYLNGFLPSLLAMVVGCLLGLAQRPTVAPGMVDHGVLLFASGVILVLPLAWLTRGLWSVQRATAPRQLALTVLGCGLATVLMVVPLAGFSALNYSVPGTRRLVVMIQDLYQGFLTPQALLICLAAAAALGWGSRRMRRSVPWVELRGSSFVFTFAAWLVLCSPWIALAGCALTQGRIAPSARWSFETLYAPPLKTTYENDPWRMMAKELAKEDPAFSTYSKLPPRWSAATVRQTETRAVQLLVGASQDRYVWNRFQNCHGLLRRAQDLKDPLEFAWLTIEDAIFDGGYYIWPEHVMGALHDIVFPTYCGDTLTEQQLALQLDRLDLVTGKIKPAREEFRQRFLDALHRHLLENDERGHRPLKAFGFELPFSPERTLVEIRARQIVYPWMELESQLDFSTYQSLGRSVSKVKAQFPGESYPEKALARLTRDAARNCAALLYRSPLQAARVLLLLRLHKLAAGTYPASLQELPLPEGMSLEGFEYQGGGAEASLTTPRFDIDRDEGWGARAWKLR